MSAIGSPPLGKNNRPTKPSNSRITQQTAAPYLAFVFGAIFCGVLAYAGLRDKPITDPGQFFIMRVLTGLSAAAVTAVIPGFITLNLGRGAMFGLRAGGSLAVFALIYWVNPPEMIRGRSEVLVASMIQNYSNGLYDDAERVAETILKEAPNNDAALNIRGGVAFYRRNYQTAVEYFEKAIKQKRDPVYVSNLSYAYVEVGGNKKAIELLETINDGKQDWSYSMGRAQLYAGEYQKAITYLQPVPTAFWRGTPRILEAAALTGLAQSESDPKRQAVLKKAAEQKFLEGYNFDRIYWRGILKEQSYDIHQGFTKPVELLRDLTRVYVQ